MKVRSKVLTKIISILMALSVALVFLAAFPQTVKAANQSVKIAFVGNSYISPAVIKDTLVNKLAENNVTATVEVWAYDDAYISEWQANQEFRTALANRNYDFVIFQEESHYVRTNTSNVIASINDLKNLNTKTHYYLFQTMSYNWYPEEQYLFTDAYNTIATGTGATVIPAGQDFWAYATANPGATMFANSNTDWQHPSDTGNMVVGNSFATALLKDSIITDYEDPDEQKEEPLINTGEDGNFVIFGNSWSEGWGAGLYYSSTASEYEIMKQGRYTRYMASALGMTEYNYALGGAGFVVDNVISWMPSNNNYMRQYSQAMSGMSEEQRNNTKIVFIMGGWNDGEHAEGLTYDTLLSKVDEIVSASITAFPNAVVVLAISQSSCNAYYTYNGPTDWGTWMTNICTEITTRHTSSEPDAKTRVVCMPEIMNMLEQNTAYYLTEGIHPNLAGHKQLAYEILEQLVAKNVISEYNNSEVTSALSFQGDANGDGTLDPRDYVRVKNHILGKTTVSTAYGRYLADANNDGTIDPRDYVRIKNRILGR